MNLIIKIIKILDEYFQKGPQGLSTYDDESINLHFEKMVQSVGEKNSQQFKNHINQLESANFEDLTFESLNYSKLVNFAQNYIKNSNGNLESIFYISKMFDKNLYEKINPILGDLSSFYPNKFIIASKWLLSTLEGVANYTNETDSIMLIHDELKIFENVIEKTKFSEISKIPDKIVSKVEKLDSNQYKLYFKDWALKFSALIESKFKNIFIYMYYFWRLEKKQKVSLKKLKYKMIGKLFTDLKIKQNYRNIDRFRVYRNKTFHTGIEFIYDEKLEDRHLILHENLSVSMTEFLFDFLKLFLFLNTFITMVNLIRINIPVNGKTPLDQYQDDLKRNLGSKVPP